MPTQRRPRDRAASACPLVGLAVLGHRRRQRRDRAAPLQRPGAELERDRRAGGEGLAAPELELEELGLEACAAGPQPGPLELDPRGLLAGRLARRAVRELGLR